MALSLTLVDCSWPIGMFLNFVVFRIRREYPRVAFVIHLVSNLQDMTLLQNKLISGPAKRF